MTEKCDENTEECLANESARNPPRWPYAATMFKQIRIVMPEAANLGVALIAVF